MLFLFSSFCNENRFFLQKGKTKIKEKHRIGLQNQSDALLNIHHYSATLRHVCSAGEYGRNNRLLPGDA